MRRFSSSNISHRTSAVRTLLNRIRVMLHEKTARGRQLVLTRLLSSFLSFTWTDQDKSARYPDQDYIYFIYINLITKAFFIGYISFNEYINLFIYDFRINKWIFAYKNNLLVFFYYTFETINYNCSRKLNDEVKSTNQQDTSVQHELLQHVRGNLFG